MKLQHSLKRLLLKKHIQSCGSEVVIHWTVRMGGNKTISLESGVFILCGALIEGAVSIGRNTVVNDYSIISAYGGYVKIGENCTVNPFAILYGHGGLTIGNGVRIASHCVLIPSDHIYSDPTIPIYKQGIEKLPIVIEDDVWIGSGAKVLGGIKIGKGSVIGAGAVVNRDIPPFSIAVGVPAKVIKQRVEESK